MRLARVAFIVVGGDDDRGELLQAAGSQSALSLDAGWNDHHTSDAFPRKHPLRHRLGDEPFMPLPLSLRSRQASPTSD
jgi:hypothetical protein